MHKDVPQTSLDAKDQFPESEKEAQHKIIISCLEKLGQQGANAYEISLITGIDDVAVNRRLKEIARDKKCIGRRGDKRLTGSHRMGFVWRFNEPDNEESTHPKKFQAADMAVELIEKTLSKSVQKKIDLEF